MVFHPFEAQRDDRAVATRFFELGPQVRDGFAVVHHGDRFGQILAPQRMDTRQIARRRFEQSVRIIHL